MRWFVTFIGTLLLCHVEVAYPHDTAVHETVFSNRLLQFIDMLHNDVYPEPPSEIHTSIMKQGIPLFVEFGEFKPGSRVLDMGCGQCIAMEMLENYGIEVVGATVGKEDYEACVAKGQNVIQQDMHYLEFDDETFDGVWIRHALEHSPVPYFVLYMIRDFLKPSGTVYLEVPLPDTAAHHENNPNHYSVMGSKQWLSLLRRLGFVIRSIRTVTFEMVMKRSDKYLIVIASKFDPAMEYIEDKVQHESDGKVFGKRYYRERGLQLE